MIKSIKLIFLLVICFPFCITAQHGSAMPENKDTIALLTAALGDLSRKASTFNEEAQAYFDQGLQLKYAFAVRDAAKSFREAQKRDPECAIFYWAEAWAMGSYLNGRLSKENAPKAYEAIQKAVKLSKKNANPIEKALIKAAKVRFVGNYDPETRGAQDTAYAEAMKEVYEAYPDDLDVATMYAEALFLLEPRRGNRDVEDPAVKRLHGILEGVLNVNIKHPGACHLYIHATESSQRPDLGAACAEYLGSSIPGASHIQHMPSHTWNEIGEWGKGVRANIDAWRSDQKAAFGEGVAIYPSHNLHMLLYAASYDGQGAIAIQAGKDYAKNTNNSMYEALTSVRFGRFEEVLEVTERPEQIVPGGMWDFAQGYARLRKGEIDFAKLYLDRVKTIADTSSGRFRGHEAKLLLGCLADILDGEIHRHNGDLNTALKSFGNAAYLEDQMRYDEPEPLPFAARHWWGAALLEAEDFAKAEEVYREELEDHPNNGWSLFGLMKAMEAQGKNIDDVKKQFEESWARSEMYIRASRF